MNLNILRTSLSFPRSCQALGVIQPLASQKELPGTDHYDTQLQKSQNERGAASKTWPLIANVEHWKSGSGLFWNSDYQYLTTPVSWARATEY